VISYTSIGNRMFGTAPLPLWIFGPLIIGAMLLLLAEEARKLIADRLTSRSSTEKLAA
jgi:sodium/potassium-transporting ATPase subunit alpha